MDLNERFGANVRAERKRKRLSMRALGERFEPPIAGPYINEVEHGRENVTLRQVQRFAKALSCTPLSLLTSKPTTESEA